MDLTIPSDDLIIAGVFGKKAPEVWSPDYVAEYNGQYRQAIIDALNVLGFPAIAQHDSGCEGCDVERMEAINIMYGALGISIADQDPAVAWNAFRQVWDETMKAKLVQNMPDAVDASIQPVT